MGALQVGLGGGGAWVQGGSHCTSDAIRCLLSGVGGACWGRGQGGVRCRVCGIGAGHAGLVPRLALRWAGAVVLKPAARGPACIGVAVWTAGGDGKAKDSEGDSSVPGRRKACLVGAKAASMLPSKAMGRRYKTDLTGLAVMLKVDPVKHSKQFVRAHPGP